MTYPVVTVYGDDLPAPFEGWDGREQLNDGYAVYVPSRFSWVEEAPLLYLEWESEGNMERMWIHTDKIDSVEVVHESEHDPQTPTNDPGDYPHSPGVLVVPTDDDVEVLRDIFNDAYEEIEGEYTAPETNRLSGERMQYVETKGSLLQELLAQLRAVEDE